MEDLTQAEGVKVSPDRTVQIAIEEARKVFVDPLKGEEAVKKYLINFTGNLTQAENRKFVSVLHDRHVAETSFIEHYPEWISSQRELNGRMLRMADTVDSVAGAFMNIIGSAWYVAGVIVSLTLGKIGIRIPTAVPLVRRVTDFAAHSASLLPFCLTCVFAFCYHMRFRFSLQRDIKRTEVIREDLLRLKNSESSVLVFCYRHCIMKQGTPSNCDKDIVNGMSKSEQVYDCDVELPSVPNIYELVKSSVEVHIGPNVELKPTIRNTVTMRSSEEQKITAIYTALSGQ